MANTGNSLDHLITVSHAWGGFRGVNEILGQIMGDFVYVCECSSKQMARAWGCRKEVEVLLNGR